MSPVDGTTIEAKQAGSTLRTASPAPGAWLFVWGLWGIMLLVNLAFVGNYGVNLPFGDDWTVIPFLTGNDPPTVSHLWGQHNEHRIPLPRLVLLGMSRLSNNDFRVPMFFDALCLVAVGGAMLLTVKWVRGWINYSDAFIPLALLHLGNSQNLLWIFTINFILSVALIYGLLLCIILSSGSLTVKPFVGAAVCLILLPLCGASGLPYIPLLGLWLVYAAVLHWRSGQAKGKRNALLILSLTLTSWVIFTLYWYGYTKPAHHPSSSSVAALLRTSLEFISMSLGPATLTLWPYAAFAVLAFLVSGAAGAILMLRSRPEKRVAILGLLLFLGACIALALGIGWGRAFRGALWERYATLAAPVLFCVYFIWVLCKRPTPAQLGQMSLFTLFCMLFPINTLDGIDWAARHRQRMEAFRNDLEAGVPAPLLAEEHPDVCPVVPNELPVPPFITNGMHLLHESGFPPFKHLNETDYEAVPFTSPPIVVSQMTWDKAEGIATGPDPSLVFALPSARYVYAVRLKYSLSNPRGVPATLRVFWKDDEQDFSTSERNLTMTVETGPEEQTVLIGVNGLIRQFRIDPGAKPGFFRVAQIELVMRPS